MPTIVGNHKTYSEMEEQRIRQTIRSKHQVKQQEVEHSASLSPKSKKVPPMPQLQEQPDE